MDAGLCETCTHRQIVETPRSRFYLCRLSFVDPRFAKYPVLPVLSCTGYRAEGKGEGEGE